MIAKLSRKFSNASLFFKISFIICALTFTVTVIISVAEILYYNSYVSKRNLADVETAGQNALNTINLNYQDMIERFVAICGTDDFLEDVELLVDPDSSFVSRELAVQDELSDLSSCNFMVSSALILSGDGQTYYSLYKNPLRSDSQDFITEEELAAVNGITWLAERSSPYRSSVTVIPVLFPLSISIIGFTHVAITDASVDTPDLYVILLLESSKIQNALEASADVSTSGSYLLLTSSGEILNPSAATKVEGLIAPATISEEFLNLATEESGAVENSVISASGCLLSIFQISNSDLYLINCAARESITDTLGTIRTLLAFLLIIVFLILITIAITVSRFITDPIHKLVTVVNQIGKNEYQEPIAISTNDETGVLSRAINSMYDTIQLQMKKIKEEEARKYKAEIQLLAEQINPHFLYNTLECIRLEILDGSAKTASNMIEYLAEYLRIGLSYGDSLITVSKEIRHAHAYVRIMNQRFQQSITFMYRIAPGLEEHLILKTILQPLVENSIRHGFSIDGKGIPISSPTIEINVCARDGFLCMEVIDNGAGFDVKKTESILFHESEESGRHVGLHNVYYRVSTFYGKEQVFFDLDSVPYYRNSIVIRFPLQSQTGSEELPRKSNANQSG